MCKEAEAVRLRGLRMTSGTNLKSSVTYSGSSGVVNWQGRFVDDTDQFTRYMREIVRDRISDTESTYESDLRGLATTGMETRFVEDLLGAVPQVNEWELGEALAECVLRDDSDMQVVWPWNTIRDRRTPRASLPGADLVGFFIKTSDVLLLFGEVKTSSDVNSPPGVMSGGSGLAWQLEKNATRLDIHNSLLQWLHARCRMQPLRGHYEKAVRRYVRSGGKDLLIVGALIRDISPSESDLKVRGEELSSKFDSPTRIELFAWYLPVPIADWSVLIQEEA